MEHDGIVMGLLGMVASFTFMPITILFTPGLTVLIDRTVRFRRMRSQVPALPHDAEEHIREWLRSST